MMTNARLAALGLSAASAASMLYVGLYQVRAVKKLICPLFGGCEAVADAPFARPFGVPDGFIALGLYAVILALLLAPVPRAGWLTWTVLFLGALAVVVNILGIADMMRLGAFCFYCLLTTILSPILLWAIWASR
jgi:uncharacterized membrane protein